MRVFAWVLLFVSLTFQAFSKEMTIRANDVLSAVSAYQNSVYYRAVLVRGDDQADLYIFTRDNFEVLRTFYTRDIAVTGIGEVDAQLKQTPDGSLQIISQNVAIGRLRWEQTLTIVYRSNQFFVGGYTYSFNDNLERDADGNVKMGDCDVNLLTGRGVRDGQPIRTSMKPIPVQDWTINTTPPECVFD